MGEYVSGKQGAEDDFETRWQYFTFGDKPFIRCLVYIISNCSRKYGKDMFLYLA